MRISDTRLHNFRHILAEKKLRLIDIAELRIGLYVELDLGWMSHPFPTGSFKINTLKQIEVIRGLGLKQVRWVPAKTATSTAQKKSCRHAG